MSYNINFDLVSIAVGIVLLAYFSRKRSAMLPSYHIFYYLLITLLSTAILNVLCVVYRLYPSVSSAGMKYLINSLSLIAMLFMGTLITVYFLCASTIDLKLPLRWLMLIYIPSSLQIGLILGFAIRGLVLGEEAYELRSHPVLIILLSASLVYLMVLCVIIAVRYRRSMRAGGMRCMTAAIVLLLLEILQLVKPEQRFVCFIASLIMSDLLLSVQRPEEVFEPSNAMKRSLFALSAEQDFARGRGFFLVFIKVLDYSVILDSLGQEDAEQFLKQLTAYLTDIKRNALVFQLESDMLVVKLSCKTNMERDSLFQEIQERFREPWHSGLMESMLSVSYVTADCPAEVAGMEQLRRLVANLDLVNFEAGGSIRAGELLGEDKEQQMLAAIRRALKEDSFQVYYQPIYSTHEKKVIAAEALIRLFDPDIGFVPPEPLITLAEKEGYILQIGEIVFREVCRFYSENKLNELGIEYIEVNLSAVQCMQHRLAEEFLAIMREFNLTSERINFEITETSAMTANAEVSRNIAHFELHGVSLSLDDYGTGYSNISYLYNLPFMIMKIDKSILWSAEDNEKADIILRNTFRMAKRLRMKVVMEGVETEAQIKKLLALNCDYFQGYYFSKPVPGDDFIKYIKDFSLPEVCKA